VLCLSTRGKNFPLALSLALSFSLALSLSLFSRSLSLSLSLSFSLFLFLSLCLALSRPLCLSLFRILSLCFLARSLSCSFSRSFSHPGDSLSGAAKMECASSGIVGVPSTEQEDMDECDGTAPCTCACFCKGTCLQSQSVPVELALFRRERSAHLQGARVCMCLRDNF